MEHHEEHVDYGTGQKTLGIYLMGLLSCVVLTLIAFWTVMSSQFSRPTIFVIIYLSAIIQFFVQLICFLRLNTATPQARNNVLTLLFTGVVLVTIIVGSLWIMANLGYNMMH